MKKINNKILLLIGFLACFFSSCKENADLLMFDTDSSYIYFALPNNTVGATRELYRDSLDFSFAFEPEESREEKVLNIPIKVAGMALNRDREVSFEIVNEGTTIDLTKIQMGKAIIKADSVTGSLTLNVKNYPALRNDIFTLNLRLLPNDEFKIGNEFNKKMRLKISDQLVEPTWWRVWVRVLGPYYYEVYQKWIEIYYPGADPSPEFYNPTQNPGPWYSWKRMPGSATASLYPVTFMYIKKLKEYFQQNEIYPNGDRTKPRILIP